MRIVAFMRHGEPHPAPPGRSVHDDRERGLTELGRRQAQGARAWLEGLDPVAALCSDSPRAVETAEIVGAPVAPSIVPGLAPEGDESAAQLLARACAALRQALPEHGNVLVVADGVTNAVLIGEVLGLAPEAALRVPQDHGNVSMLSLEDSRDQLLALNVTPLAPLRLQRPHAEAL